MKKAGKIFDTAYPEKPESKLPIDADDPIIHHEYPDFVEGIDTFGSTSEETRKDLADQPDETITVSYKELKVTCPAFKNQESIPSKFTCDGENVSPPLEIENIPDETKCLAIIVDDPDAPIATWVHWLVWNIPVTHHIKENIIHGKEGINDFEKHSYGGPCPPSGTHRYFFKVYALDALLDLDAATRKPELEKAMSDHIIAFGELIGVYKRMK